MKLGLPQVSEHKVVVQSTTYNQSKYIEDTLNGFAMQQTEFSFLCCVFDDASTDGEQGVLKSWIENHCNADEIETFDHPLTTILIAPDKDNLNCIYVFHLLKVNSYGKPEKAKLLNYWRQHGKYIALCEGDDYWTDPLKLQKQVDFLESHPDYVMCSHRFKQYMQKEGIYKDDWYGDISDGIVYDLDTLIHGGWYHHPLTVMFRSDKLDIEEYSQYPYSMDAVLFFHLLKKGPGIMLNEDMAVYRIHTGGVWSGINMENRFKNEFKARIGLYEVEQSYEAASFLRHQFAKCFGRKWMLQEWKTMMESFKILSKHFGGTNTSKLFLKKLLLNQDLKY